MKYLILALIIASSCAIPKGIKPRVYTSEHHKKPITFPFTCYRTGEYRGTDSLCWKALPQEMFSFFTLEKNGDLTRELGNITIGYARSGGDEPNKELTPKRFNCWEIDYPHDFVQVRICDDYCLLVIPNKFEAEFPVFYLFTNDCP